MAPLTESALVVLFAGLLAASSVVLLFAPILRPAWLFAATPIGFALVVEPARLQPLFRHARDTRTSEPPGKWDETAPTELGPLFSYTPAGIHRKDVETVSVDGRGRVTIPKERREELGLGEKDELVLSVEEGELRLRPKVRKQLKVRAGRRWGREAFPRSREASFADEE